MSDKFTKIDESWLHLNISKFIYRKAIILTGAGISVSSGIPDFRSENGIFSEIRKTLKIKGEDLFNYRFSRENETRSKYYQFISKLKVVCDTAKPSFTHSFLNEFKDHQQKFRLYTQNIDGLEERAGMINTDKGNSELLYLHGDMKILICIYCGFKVPYTDKENKFFLKGEDITCIKCKENNIKRMENKQRQAPTGYMHTNIIHYHQPHYDGHRIAKLFESDADVDLFIVIGTSLKVYGVKDLVKRGLRCCLKNNGTSIFVNLEDPTKEFKDLFKYFWKGDSDTFCKNLKENITKYKIDNKIKSGCNKKKISLGIKDGKFIDTSIIEETKASNKDNLCVIKESKKENKILKVVKSKKELEKEKVLENIKQKNDINAEINKSTKNVKGIEKKNIDNNEKTRNEKASFIKLNACKIESKTCIKLNKIDENMNNNAKQEKPCRPKLTVATKSLSNQTSDDIGITLKNSSQKTSKNNTLLNVQENIVIAPDLTKNDEKTKSLRKVVLK